MYILYKTTNTINGKYYIGIHKTDNLNDGYLGSGVLLKQSIKKYGKENFVRIILSEEENYERLNELEREIVNEEFVKRRDTYNLEIGGRGGKVWTEEMRKKHSISQKKRFKENPETNGMLGKTGLNNWTAEQRTIQSKRMIGENNPMYGKNVKDKMSEEKYEQYKKNISKGNTGKVRTEEHKKNYSSAASKRIWLVHKSGKITNTQNPNDERLSHPDWQNGIKWKL